MTYQERLTDYCLNNFIKKKSIALYVGISEQELYNILNGFQRTVKGLSVDEVKQKIHECIGTNI